MNELRITGLQNRVTIDYCCSNIILMGNNSLACVPLMYQIFPSIGGQISDVHNETDKISQVNSEWPSG